MRSAKSATNLVSAEVPDQAASASADVLVLAGVVRPAEEGHDHRLAPGLGPGVRSVEVPGPSSMSNIHNQFMLDLESDSN